VRTEVFQGIGGFDERFEGWGGEDDDVIARLAQATKFARFEDELLHMHHLRPQMVRDDGKPMNGHLQTLMWSSAEQFGDPSKYSPAAN
jgi:hypothetical protein